MFDLAAVQSAIREDGLDAWLLYDFRGLNVLARRVLPFAPDAHLTRRWFYLIPANGTPQKLVHRIESGALDIVPGDKSIYLRWQELEAGVQKLVQGCKRIAMETIARNANPYVSRVDAGTVELVRSFGPEIVSSGDLIQRFEACWSESQWQLHLQAAEITNAAYTVAANFISEQVRAHGNVRESAVQQVIMDHFRKHGAVTDSTPIVGVGPHSGDPHYHTTPETDVTMGVGDFVLIDLWAKMNHPDAVYSDLTRTFVIGAEPSAKHVEVFNIVRDARDAGIARVKAAFSSGETLQGWQVDDAVRAVIEKAGYGEQFCHRTGHSIGRETHGNGANMDNLETKETRRVMPRTCFSIEPGIYLPEFGVRSEIDVYVDANGGVHVTGGELQTEIIRIPV
ncbi:M24 family metallopeptidase [Tuwongella immobilis]|uniref:Peptidase M24 domain-containing protein n=1 Tax=Tuwongella immobilis TaxID=692036 RepID=A0A6C2YQV1_9BACT|nr:M24 family metallopeptidase [Tuwongella immobilis]VIP03262.1 peptidase m24 : Peptidase M24 OS=Planctomyces limnophilus (strain ATCC 43296 / DSM 3776 / IFAM 1008 / 290) GN=Plim_0332 PE=4 SV=1: Peptidase_M24 [Tuwongella immobilis]VTS03874.1 peptidase m24 : Peptidase M24 OS=Planctomyces limnophilus (strain ATCC 43296 / DSM 3776 / IFAM 1008 / 290) GN=Plim_0332 PE=4 SV=1: Peptidase_M24 [Tuwongella immobilis]